MCVFVHLRVRGCILYVGGGRAAACGDLMLMRSVMGLNREREGNRLGLHWQAPLSLRAAVCSPIYSPISMRLGFDLSAANDSKITSPLESYTSATEHPFMISSFIFSTSFPTDTQTGIISSASEWGGCLDWNELYLSHHVNDHSFDYANSGAETVRRSSQRKVIKRRHQITFWLRDHPCIRRCFYRHQRKKTHKTLN